MKAVSGWFQLGISQYPVLNCSSQEISEGTRLAPPALDVAIAE